MASPTNTTKTYHGGQIAEGFAVVSLDQIVDGYEELELDIPGGEGEKVLQEALHGFILWQKRYIVIPNAPRPSTAGGAPPPPNDLDGGDSSPHKSPSPTPRKPSPNKRSPSPPPSKPLPAERSTSPNPSKPSPKRSPSLPPQPPPKRQHTMSTKQT